MRARASFSGRAWGSSLRVRRRLCHLQRGGSALAEVGWRARCRGPRIERVRLDSCAWLGGSVRVASWLLALVALAAAPSAWAQAPTPSLSGYVTLASGYWKHGLSQNDGASLQLGVDYQHQSGFFVGGGAASVEFAREYSTAQPRDIEANVYAGFSRRHPTWSWNAGLGHYAYPGAALDYAYNDVSATLGFRDRVFYTAAYSNDYYGAGNPSLDQTLSAVVPLRGDFEISAAVGKFRIEYTDLNITHWNLGMSKLVQKFAVDLRYYDGDYAWQSYYGDPDANHYVLSVSYGLR